MSVSAITLEILSQTRNASALPMLRAGLDGDPSTRQTCLAALSRRGEMAAAEVLIDRWNDWTESERHDMRQVGGGLRLAVAVRLHWATPGDAASAVGAKPIDAKPIIAALRVAGDLCLDAVFGSVVDWAEHGPEKVRTLATDVAIRIATELGQAARLDRPVASRRGPVLERLGASMRNFESHRTAGLIDALLAVSTWSDATIMRHVEDDHMVGRAIRTRLSRTDRPAGLDLAAGFLTRRNLPDAIAAMLRERPEPEVGRAILAAVGNQPSTVTRRHLKRIAPCRSLERPGAYRPAVAPERAALLHVRAAADDFDRLMPDLVAAASDDSLHRTVAKVMGQMTPPPAESLIEAARRPMPPTGPDHRPDDAMERLRGWIEVWIGWLDHDDPAIAAAVRRWLSPLMAGPMMGVWKRVPRRDWSRLAAIVTRVDPAADRTVADRLRHPVLNERIDAIEAVEALSMVDRLREPLRIIADGDHQSARIRVVGALANSHHDETRSILRGMLTLPEGSVRDAAVAAMGGRS